MLNKEQSTSGDKKSIITTAMPTDTELLGALFTGTPINKELPTEVYEPEKSTIILHTGEEIIFNSSHENGIGFEELIKEIPNQDLSNVKSLFVYYPVICDEKLTEEQLEFLCKQKDLTLDLTNINPVLKNHIIHFNGTAITDSSEGLISYENLVGDWNMFIELDNAAQVNLPVLTQIGFLRLMNIQGKISLPLLRKGHILINNEIEVDLPEGNKCTFKYPTNEDERHYFS